MEGREVPYVVRDRVSGCRRYFASAEEMAAFNHKGDAVPDDLITRCCEIIDDARRRLNVEKGHSLCTEECDCPMAVRLVEESLLQAEKALQRHGTLDGSGVGNRAGV